MFTSKTKIHYRKVIFYLVIDFIFCKEFVTLAENNLIFNIINDTYTEVIFLKCCLVNGSSKHDGWDS